MSKEADKIIDAYHMGENDKRLKRPCNNPFNKNKEKNKYKAYKNGFNQTIVNQW